jgi:hypothetical protein
MREDLMRAEAFELLVRIEIALERRRLDEEERAELRAAARGFRERWHGAGNALVAPGPHDGGGEGP